MSALLPQLGDIPSPRATAVSQPFWDGCARRVLLYQRCAACGLAMGHPATRCRRCHAPDPAWTRSEGAGMVYSWSTVWHPQSSAFTTPYTAVIVELDEGFLLTSSMVGCDTDDVVCGLRVKVVFHRITDGALLPYFEPA